MSADAAILVNGLPGAGKSTLSTGLAKRLGLPLLSKDVIKETHADVLGCSCPGYSQRDWNSALGRAASTTMWALLAAAPAGAVLESSWRSEVRDLVVEGLGTSPHLRVVEVWCQVPAAVARARLEARRPRHPIHGALPSDSEWRTWEQHAEPLALGPVLCVDTSSPVDVDRVIDWIVGTASVPPPERGVSTPAPVPGCER